MEVFLRVLSATCTSLRPGQMPVFDAMGLVVCRAETFFPVRLVFGIVSFKPDDFTVTLEGKDVGGNSIQEPAFMLHSLEILHYQGSGKKYEFLNNSAKRNINSP